MGKYVLLVWDLYGFNRSTFRMWFIYDFKNTTICVMISNIKYESMNFWFGFYMILDSSNLGVVILQGLCHFGIGIQLSCLSCNFVTRMETPTL